MKKSHNNGDASVITLKKGADCLLWQTLASVLIPGKVINMVTNYAHKTLNPESGKPINIPPVFRKWGPTAIGLLTIPLIIEPIDYMVEELMEHTFRKL